MYSYTSSVNDELRRTVIVKSALPKNKLKLNLTRNLDNSKSQG